MAKIEAYCTNCGSLINVDDSKQKATCIFCGQEIDTAKAVSLNSDNESRMLVQKAAAEKAREEAAARKEMQKSGARDMPAKQKAEKTQGPKQEVILKPLPARTKLILLASFVGFALVIAAIFVPLIITRNANRLSFRDTISSSFGIEDPDSAITFKYNDNRELMLSTKDMLGEEGAREIYEKYVSVYSEAYGIDRSKAEKKTTVVIFDKEGRYTCSYKDGKMNVSFETGSPTHTPQPTAAASN